MVDKSEKFNWFVRLGYLSRAVLYMMLGLVALTSAGEISNGTDGIFRAVEGFPAGIAVLWLMAAGLFFYALFRFASLFFDIENEGQDAKGWGKRIGHAGSGIGHLVLAYSAYHIATTAGGGSGDGAEQAATGVLGFPFGGVVLGILGIVFFVVAAFQVKKGVTGEFMKRISPSAPDASRWLGAVGYCARGVVYAAIGWSLFQTGFLSQGADNVMTLGDALASLAGQGALFTATAIGLLIFGIFSFILARYRIIPHLDADAGVPEFRAG